MKKKHAFHWHINFYLVLFFLVTMLGVSLLAHHRYAERQRKWYGDLPEIQKRGVLRALTLYSSASYFIYRDKEMGYEYELCAQLARSLGLKLKIITAPNLLALKDSLDAGVGDIVAYNVPVTLSNRDKYLYCGRDFLTHYVVVQREDNPQLVTEVTQLVGKEVYVEKGTNMELRLQHLNEELGGGIIIKPVEEDSITTEELIGRVARGQLDYVIADNVTAQWNKTYYRSLHVSTQIGFPQKNAWLVRYDSPKLAAAVNEWFKKNLPSENYQAIQKKYFELSKGHTPFVAGGRLIGKDGHISPYDSLFKKHAAAHGIDWRLLVSIAYQESKFDPKVVSWSGAVGLMQLMPQTAAKFGLPAKQLLNPDLNILAATRLFKSLERHFASINDSEQRLKLVLASFNSGLGHIEDARALARKYRKNPDRWDGEHVSHFVELKSKPAYYDDPVCKQGYLRGTETTDFVSEVWFRYQYYIRKGIK